jgi:hypothetical protein
MKNRNLWTMLLGSLFFLSSNAQDFAFQTGEKIKFTVFYNVVGLYVNAGTATKAIFKRKTSTKWPSLKEG